MSHDRTRSDGGSTDGSAATVQDLRGPSELRSTNEILDSRVDPGWHHPLLHLPIVGAESAIDRLHDSILWPH